jgi:hypothetical protein
MGKDMKEEGTSTIKTITVSTKTNVKIKNAYNEVVDVFQKHNLTLEEILMLNAMIEKVLREEFGMTTVSLEIK